MATERAVSVALIDSDCDKITRQNALNVSITAHAHICCGMEASDNAME